MATLVEAAPDLLDDASRKTGKTPLCCAVEAGSIEVVTLLLARGANVNYANRRYSPPPFCVSASCFLVLCGAVLIPSSWKDGEWACDLSSRC